MSSAPRRFSKHTLILNKQNTHVGEEADPTFRETKRKGFCESKEKRRWRLLFYGGTAVLTESASSCAEDLTPAWPLLGHPCNSSLNSAPPSLRVETSKTVPSSREATLPRVEQGQSIRGRVKAGPCDSSKAGYIV